MADDERPPSPDPAGGLSRRGFLTTAGLGAVGLAAVRAAAPPEAEPPPDPAADARLPVTLRVNGRTHRLR
ncbi:MAG: twin-arginine translocation signal domain-containing protein, partial [Acidobacteria bacterium]|nr:twin-arginine translocation signal domain-containing protein [Acidobacteriota bacterium]